MPEKNEFQDGYPPNNTRPETDLRHIYERKMKIQCFRALCLGQTDRVTPWAP